MVISLCGLMNFRSSRASSSLYSRPVFCRNFLTFANVFGSLGSLALVTVANQSTLPTSPHTVCWPATVGSATRMRRFSSKAAAASTLIPKYSAAISPSVGLLGAAVASQGAHQVPSLEVAFLESRPDFFGE